MPVRRYLGTNPIGKMNPKPLASAGGFLFSALRYPTAVTPYTGYSRATPPRRPISLIVTACPSFAKILLVRSCQFSSADV